MSLSHAILTIEKIVEHPREVTPIWRDALDWKEKIYYESIDNIDNALKHYLSDLLKIKENLSPLDVDLMDNFEENVLKLNEMMHQFKDNYQKKVRDPQSISLESFKSLCHLQIHTSTFESKMDKMHRNIATTDGLVAKWKTRLQITTIPEDANMEPAMNKYHEYRQRIKA